ncbi:phage baseplate assembly protein V [Nocardioides conyzicola]|uniref:Gp5/Type VI secretion system Vgr protein OB-fold domain-containing protein n=1 Tax=Nocardioides conyzicola TaxID=1651781 RepID=A0ABP8XZD5_9ACTN
MTQSTTEPDRPAFEVRVAGSAIAPLDAADVVEIDVHEEVGRHGRCTLLVQNWNADTRTVRHSDSGPFTPGAALAVSLGYHAQLTTVFEGVIAALTTHFPRSGRPVLRIEARSKSILLEHPPRSRQLAEASDADLASAIAADYSLGTDAADGVTREQVVTDRVSDWDALKARAGELGWVTYVRGDTLVLRPPAAQQDPIQLDYTRSVVELELTEDLTHAIDGAVGVAWDIDSLEAAESEQSASAAGIATGDRPAHDAAVGDAGWPLRTARTESPAMAAADAADAAALAAQRGAALAHHHGSGVVQGDPALRCDSWLSIQGVGTRMSGPHYVSASRHRLSAGRYLTEFQVGAPPRLTPPGDSARPAYPSRGTVLGVVESLDDPESLNRVQVRLPWRTDNGAGVWARLCCLDAGDGYGVVMVPSVGQEVVVAFVDGDPSTALVLGSVHNGTQQPPEAVDASTNAVRTIVTPDQHLLRLEDGSSAAVTLATGKGHSLVLNDTDSEVVLTHADSGNAIRISADGIELTAAQGDITLTASAGAVKIDALTLEGKASGTAKLESSATFDLKASGSLGLKGSLITIN